jgi:hypothetical protein
MKNLIKTVALIAAIAPTASFAGNMPVDFPTTFIAGSAPAAQVVTKLDTHTVNVPAGQTVKK